MREETKKQPTLSGIEGFIPPHEPELEDAVIGALMIENTAFSRVEDDLMPEYFYDVRNQAIYQAVRDISTEGRAIDMLTVVNQLKRNKALDQVGGPTRISELTGKVSSTVSLELHALIIKQKAIEREAILNARQVIGSVQEGEDIGDVLFSAGRRIETLQEALIGKTGGNFISDIVQKADKELSARMELARKNVRTGIDTGLNSLNKKTNGWQKSDLIILAARPAVGKTALMLHFAKAAALSGVPVCVFSLEMSDVSLVNRMILSIADVNAEKFKSGYISNEEYGKIQDAMQILSRLPIYIDDYPNSSMAYIRAKCRLLRKKSKCGMIFIDYLQLADGDDKSGNREQEVSKMSRMAKKIAKELEVPLMLLSQLSRRAEERKEGPQLADLRESGAIEQDADMVIFPIRYGCFDSVVDEAGRPITEKNFGELKIAKYRNGSTGRVKFKHSENLTSFFDYDETSNYEEKAQSHQPLENENAIDVPF